MFHHEKKGVVVQRERRRVGVSWGDTKAGVARVTGIVGPTQKVPWSFPIFFLWFLYFPYQEANTHSASSSRGVDAKQVTDKYLTHKEFRRPAKDLWTFLLLNSTLFSRSFFPPSLPSFSFPLHSFWDIVNRTTNKGTSTVPASSQGSSLIAATNRTASLFHQQLPVPWDSCGTFGDLLFAIIAGLPAK